MTAKLSDKLVFALLLAAGILLVTSLALFQYGQAIAFYLLATIMVVSAVGVLTLKDIIKSAFLLALTFMSVGGLFVLLHADFLAAAQILIYAGAVVILMVFGVMLTQRSQDRENVHSLDYHLATLAFVGLGLLVLLLRAVANAQWNLATGGATTLPTINTVAVIGKQFFNPYILPFEIASVILLMALIGAIVIAKKEGLVKS